MGCDSLITYRLKFRKPYVDCVAGKLKTFTPNLQSLSNVSTPVDVKSGSFWQIFLTMIYRVLSYTHSAELENNSMIMKCTICLSL